MVRGAPGDVIALHGGMVATCTRSDESIPIVREPSGECIATIIGTADECGTPRTKSEKPSELVACRPYEGNRTMLKGLILLVVGGVIAIAGVIILLNPGAQGDTGGGGIALLGALIAIRAVPMLIRAGGPVAGGSTVKRSAGEVGFVSRRRVIAPQDSRPRPPFKL